MRSGRERLDKIISLATQRINLKASYTKEEAIVILEAIDAAILEAGIRLGDNPYPFCIELSTGKADCDGFSIIYSAVGEHLKLPIEIVHFPRHSMVQWIIPDESPIYWETRADEGGKGKAVSFNHDEVLKRMHVTQQSIDQGFFGRPLREVELLDSARIPALNTIFRKINSGRAGDLRKLKESYELIVRNSNRKNILALTNLMMVHIKLNEFADARKLAEEILAADPNDAKVWGYLGQIHDHNGETIEAINAYKRAIECYNERIKLQKIFD